MQNNMSQGAVVNGSVPIAEVRMIRTERYKYCVYSYGDRRESLVDLQDDPGEKENLTKPNH